MDNWYLVKTKPRQEHIAIKNLQNQDFTTYCPMVKINNNLTPLFGGYVFVQKNNQDIHPIKSTKGVASIVRFGNDFALVKHNIIEELKQKESGITERFIDMKQFHTGDKVEILDGVFKGNHAIFTETSSQNRVILLLKFINQEHKITIDKSNIKKF